MQDYRSGSQKLEVGGRLEYKVLTQNNFWSHGTSTYWLYKWLQDL